MNIVFLTHYYPPEVGAPQGRIQALARALRNRGAEVTVHTGFPHYPVGAIALPYRNRLLSVENDGGVRIVRSLVYPAANRGMVRRLIDHATFAASALATGHAAGRTDVVVAESPPLFLAAAAPMYAKLRRARLLLHVSDLWPDSAVELGALRHPRAIGAARLLERHAYTRSAAIVAPTSGIVRKLEGRPEAAGKAHRIYPAVDLERFDIAPLRREGPLRVLYAGTVGMAQGLSTLVDAARLVGPDRVRVVIAGDGAELTKIRKAAAGVGHVKLLGALPADAVPRLYADADAAVVLLRDRPLFRDALPTKMLEAMAAGRPLLLSAAGESADLLERAGAGVVVPPDNAPALAEAMIALACKPQTHLREAGARGADFVRAFDRRATADRWWTLLDRLVT